jgi:hypothetical protein
MAVTPTDELDGVIEPWAIESKGLVIGQLLQVGEKQTSCSTIGLPTNARIAFWTARDEGPELPPDHLTDSYLDSFREILDR